MGKFYSLSVHPITAKLHTTHTVVELSSTYYIRMWSCIVHIRSTNMSTLCFYINIYVHVVMCVHMGVYVCTWVCMCAHGCVCVHMGVCVCTWVCVCAHGCVCVHMGVCVCTWVCMCAHGCVGVYMGVCVHARIHVHICLHTDC